MSEPVVRVLLVEDNDGDAFLIDDMIASASASAWEASRASSIDEARSILASSTFDAILLDLSLPDGRGISTLERVRESANDTPVVVLTGLGDDQLALRAVKEGAQDYLVKGEFDARTLFRSVQYAIERRRTERVERERRSLESALGAMDHLLGVLGHELRTPLTSLRLLSEYMLTDQSTAVTEWDRLLGSINSEVLRMTDLVNNLLEAARLDSGVSQWRWSEVAAKSVCDEVLALMRPLLKGSKLQLDALVSPLDLRFKGDPDAIRRLLINLVSNAVKHTREGRIDIEVTSTQSGGHRCVQLVVRDTGGGIPDRIAQRLGDAFAINSGVAGTSSTGGTGLGLAICKGIAAVHGGQMSVATKVGVGTTFTATLRADLSEPAEIPEDLKIIREAAA